MKRKLCKKSMFVVVGILFSVYLAMSLLLNGRIHLDIQLLQTAKKDRYLQDTDGFTPQVKTDVCDRENTNFVFIKCMKCATETMATIIRRFGYVRNLNFALPVKRNLYFGWPFPIEVGDVRPSQFAYDILMEHSIYNRTVMRSLMPSSTVFITIIRHPWNQFKSTFNYFDLGRIVKIPNKNITEYLENMEFYETIYKSSENNIPRWCIPDGFSVTKNIMSHCLGMPVGFPNGRTDISENPQLVQEYIKTLDKDFSLVMIADYFQESLVLLKIKMCWGFKDVLYHKVNVGEYVFKSLPMQGRLYEIHRNWSKADYILFEHFNASFWNKIESLGQNFYDQLEHFRLIQMVVERFCFVEHANGVSDYVTIPRSKFDGEFNVTGVDCNLMSTYMLPMLWARYYEREGMEPEDFGKPEHRPKPPKGCSI